MEITIRTMTPADRDVWSGLRAAMWPEESREEHARFIDGYFRDGDAWGLVVEAAGKGAVAFAEISLRKHANGCESSPVPFLEAIWVAPDVRRQGIGRRLIRHIEMLLAAQGHRELGSDALLDNRASHVSHRAWGFEATERVVYFRKILAR